MNLPCCVNSPCQDPANPIANFSAEQPDQEVYIGYNSGWGGNVPPLGDTWGTPGCISFCQSTVSQADADTCAANQQLACTVTRGPTDPTNNPGWQNPDGNPTPLFSNSAQHCDIICPDNRVFRFTIPAGQYTGLSQAQANAVAQSFACIIGQSERLCMNNIDSPACVDEFYADVIDTEGGTAPLSYSIVSGSLPPGLVFEQPDEFEATVSGTPTTPGTYSFTVRVVDRFGLFMVKTFTLGVLGVTNTPDDATINADYTFQFTAAGGTEPYTFSADPDTLPDGLTLSSSGLLSGTPTEDGDFDINVTVTDSSP